MDNFAEMCGTYIAEEMRKDREKKQKNCKHNFEKVTDPIEILQVDHWTCAKCGLDISIDDISEILNRFADIENWLNDK